MGLRHPRENRILDSLVLHSGTNRQTVIEEAKISRYGRNRPLAPRYFRTRSFLLDFARFDGSSLPQVRRISHVTTAAPSSAAPRPGWKGRPGPADTALQIAAATWPFHRGAGERETVSNVAQRRSPLHRHSLGASRKVVLSRSPLWRSGRRLCAAPSFDPLLARANATSQRPTSIERRQLPPPPPRRQSLEICASPPSAAP